jgi:hypothetical protein
MVRRLVSEDRANHKEARSMRMVSSPDVFMWCANLPVSEPLRLCLRFSLLRSSQTRCNFQLPFRKTNALAIANVEKAIGIAMKTPVAPTFQ